jgi:sporulation integral membrane protein YtvI
MEIKTDIRTERRKRFIINLLYWAAILGALYFILNYVIGWLLPLLIGFGIARLLNPLIRLIAKKTRIPRKPIAFAVVLLFLGVVGTPLVFLVINLFHIIREQVNQFGAQYEETIVPSLRMAENWLAQNLGMFFPNWEVGGEGGHLIEWLTDRIGDFINAVNFGALAAQTPAFLLRVLFTGLFTLFSCVYYQDALAFILRQMGPKKRLFLSETITSLKRSIVSYYGAYLKIMLLSFAQLVIGLSIVRGQFSPLLAFSISLLDFIPAIGCGIVFFPWIAICLIIGDTGMALGLGILYIIVFILRQIVEPKILGDQLGLNPLLTLTAMYLGYLAIGVLGLIIMPIVVTVIADLQRKEKISVVK